MERHEKKYKRMCGRFFAVIAAAAVGISTFGYTGYQIPQHVYAAEADTATVTVDKLNVRKGAGTNYDKLTQDETEVYLTKGQKAEILAEKDGWYKVSFQFQGKTMTGYVSGEYVTVTKSETGGGDSSGTETGDGSTSDGSTTDGSSGSGKTEPSSETEYLPLKVAGRITGQGLRVRTGPGTTYKQLTVGGKGVSLEQDTKVTITGTKTESGECWYRISFTYEKKKRTGYVLGDYVTLMLASGKSVNVKGSLNRSLYVRTKATASSKYILTYNKKKMSVKPGKKCIIYYETTVGGVKWYKVKFYYGKKLLTGYIMAKYVDFRQTEVVKEEPPADETPDTEEPENPDGGTETPDEGEAEKPDDGSKGDEDTETELMNAQKANVVNGPVEIRSEAGFGSNVLRDESTGLAYQLTSGQEVTVYGKETVSGSKWYLITYTVNQNFGAGYVPAEYIELSENSGNSSSNGNMTVLSEAEFEASMNTQGFPESYKPYLRNLHAAHPYWKFEARQVMLDWNTVIAKESMVGVNLIENSRNLAWKSMESNAYSWQNDKFVPYDGAVWVTASKEAVEYYMDPRNFLTENGIYQFELLSYQPEYQTESGVESILSGTPMKSTSYSYQDTNGASVKSTYAKTFLAAAAYSGVSPYHLASRAKQEVVTSSTALSSSVSGTVSGYENLYNFYNIGATHSTIAGGAIINALKYAQNGTAGKNYTSTVTFNDYILIPWNSPYRSIVGGAAFIGYNYIQRGQNTVYLEKFNVTGTSTYSHQYMANVEGAASESSKTAAAYRQMEEIPVAFSIPVYQNMPTSACPAPADRKNPNNWLKSLTVDGYSLTPTFDSSADQVYSLIVGKSASSVTISGETASKLASVSGFGTMKLAVGSNTAVITVTAEDGSIRTYTIQIIREG